MPPIGKTPERRVARRRYGLSVNVDGDEPGPGARWKVFEGVMILDNLKIHHAKPITAWLAEHGDESKVFYLPS